MSRVWWIFSCKRCENRQFQPNLYYKPRIILDRLIKSMENCQDNWFLSSHSNQISSKYRLGYLSHEATYLIIKFIKFVGHSYMPQKVNVTKTYTGHNPMSALHFSCILHMFTLWGPFLLFRLSLCHTHEVRPLGS